jgi:hypothetical protein
VEVVSIDKLLSVGMLAEELKCSGRNREEDFIEDAWTVHHVDALVHDTLVVKEVLAKKSMNFDYPPYFPDFVPCKKLNLKIL